MQIYSHSKRNELGEKEGTKLLIDHLKGVRDKTLQNLFPSLRFGYSQKTITRLLEIICWMHDIGKFTSFFQRYLLTEEKIDNRKKAHTAFGAQVTYQLLKEEPDLALLSFYLIRMHHSNLFTFETVVRPPSQNFNELVDKSIFLEQKNNLLSYDDLIKEFSPAERIVFNYREPKVLYNQYRKIFKKEASIERYYLINYLFSLLIEADKMDASYSSVYSRSTIPENAVDNRFGKVSGHTMFSKQCKNLEKLSIEQLRNFVRYQVEKNLNNNDILDKRIFTLAAPTGIGKTMASLSFVLKLRKRIHEEEKYLPQIIYGLPFINIIEQSLSEYEKTIQAGKIIGHYQYADIFGADDQSVDFLNDKEKSYSQKQMEWDTWQSDIVITSFVQFFETLIGNRNKLLKKFHHVAGSIIILDEVQTLPIEKLPVIGAAIYYLARYLDARVIIMTATQPKLFELMEKELNINTESHLNAFNLLPRADEVFASFNRTKIVPLIENKIDDDSFLKLFQQKWDGHKTCLIVVNKVQRSIDIFNLLKNKLKGEGVNLHYLSTNITPIEREKRIQDIRKLLPHKKCILVATQVVEAGVDLDFDMGFRDLGPIDSIVQVAGRINRENSQDRLGSPLYIIDFGDCGKIYGVGTDSRARLILKNIKEIEERNYKQLVESYFEKMAGTEVTDFSFSREIFDAMINLRYQAPPGVNLPHMTVSDFQIIEKKHAGISVFIESPEDPIGIESREAYQELHKGEIKKGEFDERFKRIFNQRIISVPSFVEGIVELKDEEKLSENILWVKSGSVKYYYEPDTGFIRSKSFESETVFF